MKFTTAAIAATAATLVSASPCGNPLDQKINDNDVFNILTIRSGSDIQYGRVQAANGGLLINTASQNASCGPENPNYASFQLSKGDLYLYTANPPQQMYVDRSGMGQGVIRYTTGVQGIGRNQERTGFTIDENNHLVWKDTTGQTTGLQACPNAAQGGYSVWLAGVTNPGGNKDCVGFVGRAIKADKPLKCMYTEGS